MKLLRGQLNELETKISKQEIYNNDGSKSNVGWYIEHKLLTIITIIENVKKSNPLNYKFAASKGETGFTNKNSVSKEMLEKIKKAKMKMKMKEKM